MCGGFGWFSLSSGPVLGVVTCRGSWEQDSNRSHHLLPHHFLHQLLLFWDQTPSIFGFEAWRCRQDFTTGVLLCLHLSLSLIPAISPCSQSQGRKHFPVSRIVVRKHSPPATFPANFSGELSGDGFFLHRKERLEEISNLSQSTGTRNPSTRRPRAFFRPATASHAPAREGA